MSLLNSIYNQSMAQSNIGQTPRDFFNRSEAPMSKQDQIDQITAQITMLTAQLEKLTLDNPLSSPTQRQLNSNPALQHAWNEFNVIWKLAGK